MSSEIATLADLFGVWIGKNPDNRAEIARFLHHNSLEGVLDVSDVDSLLRGEAYLADYALPVIYKAMPVSFVINDKKVTVLPEEFNRLNQRAATQKRSLTAISPSGKLLRELNERLGDTKTIAVRKEKARRRQQKYRAANPDKVKQQALQRWQREKDNMPLERKQALDKARQKYSRLHQTEIAARNKAKRRQQKLENPLAVYERDYQVNHAVNRPEIKKRYYETHRAQILAYQRESAKQKAAARKYKAKVRFRTKTGAKIMALLNGLLAAKTRN